AVTKRFQAVFSHIAFGIFFILKTKYFVYREVLVKTLVTNKNA
ncbi:MAG: hypothetical protein JWQ14_3234, partial [Adhaeribacter sp.]|nr:hypothetical protein [Adhaeribacter sp.]